MLQIRNATPFATERAILWGLDCAEHWVVVVKGTFRLATGEEPAPLDEQLPVVVAPVYTGEPGKSGLQADGEMILAKPGADVLVIGAACAPGGRRVEELPVRVRVGDVREEAIVLGDREWRRGLTGPVPSAPAPFDRLELGWERAYGGTDRSADDPRDHRSEDRNPVGRGFVLHADTLLGAPAPNLERPDQRIRSWRDRPEPVGFGPIPPLWQPRRGWAGTYDEAWQRERLPFWPTDLDPRFFHTAPPRLCLPRPLRGGEPIELDGLSPEGPVRSVVPRVVLGFRTLLGGAWIDHVGRLDTLVLEPEAKRMTLTWRTSVPCDRRKLELERTNVWQKELR